MFKKIYLASMLIIPLFCFSQEQTDSIQINKLLEQININAIRADQNTPIAFTNINKSNIEKSLLIPIFFMFDVRTAVRLASDPEPAIVGIPILWTPLFFTKSHPWYSPAEPSLLNIIDNDFPTKKMRWDSS